MSQREKKPKAKKYQPGVEILDFETLLAVAEKKDSDIKEIIGCNLGLDLTGISSKFSDAFCKAVKIYDGLEILSITDSFINGDQAHRLAHALKEHPTLKRLILRGNAITSSGVEMMSQQLAGNSVITVLDLDENGIGPDLPVSIIAALPSLAKLNLYGNHISRISPKFLRAFPPTLEDLDLRQNALKKADLENIVFPPRWLVEDQHTNTRIVTRRRSSLAAA